MYTNDIKPLKYGSKSFSKQGKKPSFYNLFFEIGGRSVTFNTLRASICELPPDVISALESNDLSRLPFETLSDLESEGFLVEEDHDELAEYLEKYEVSKEIEGGMAIQLFLATSCNLGCSYCYQAAPVKSGNVIKKEAIDRLLIWLEEEFSQGKLKFLQLEFFGGEPLLARLQLPRLIRDLNALSSKYDVPVEYNIITNATLLTDELIELFVSNRVHMQITLDGDHQTHDQRRAWKGTDKGSFEQIFANLEKISSKGGADLVLIRMNVDQNNISEVEAVATRIKSLGIMDFSCGRIHFREKNVDYESVTISSKDFDETFDWEIFKILKPLGLADAPVDLESKTTCRFHLKKGFSLSPSLDVFKCDELIDNPEFRVGHIDEQGKLHLVIDEYERQVSRKPTDFDDCSSCRYLPQCGSGCSIRALNVKGSPHEHFCEATYDSVRSKVTSYLKAEEAGMIDETQENGCSNCLCGA